VLPVKVYDENKFVFMATSSGTVKKTSLVDFSRPRSNGIIAVDLRGDDTLVGVDITDGTCDVMLFSTAGKSVRFKESDVRVMGRNAAGVRGIRLQDGQKLIALMIARGTGAVLTATENGYGKRTPLADYPVKGRGGLGVISIQTSERNGNVIGAVLVDEKDEIMLISNQGTLVRTRCAEVSEVGRNTQGVRLINVAEGERLVSIERIAEGQDGALADLPEGGEAGIAGVAPEPAGE